MRVLLDTHILVTASAKSSWNSLGAKRVQMLQQRGVEVFFAGASLWEIAKLYELKRIDIGIGLEEYLIQLEHHRDYKQVYQSSLVLAKMVEIAPLMHRDPSDQLIVATALVTKAKLMTDDALIRKLDWIETV